MALHRPSKLSPTGEQTTLVYRNVYAELGRDRVTDYDGRCMQLYPEAAPGQKREDLIKLQAGRLYKVVFKTKDYFESTGRKCFYPWVEITFEVPNPAEHYHIPLLISPYSYTTYRGS
ncbi:hypothetical protein ONZ51_g3736 [Trametes cubensis]|uniref:5-hydroxyisourate hydrolase n=1 Tax=Trametes cubensis TaxID=1111947 RepID=A0AAD7TZG2_9APHY|nr:hypothetical protein ONZ51_g3736 [Trametes cubensis]